MCKELLDAIKSNCQSKIEKYIDDGGDINVTDSHGYTLLHSAAEYGRLEIVKYLLYKGNNFDILENNGFSPLLIACREGNLKIVSLLMSKGSNTHLSSSYLPMHVAAAYGKNNVLKYLSKKNLDINEKDRGGNGFAPLYWAVQEGHLSTVKLIIAMGGDPNCSDEDMTLLYTAAGEGHTRIVQYLIDQGANLEGNPNVCSPLTIACCFNHYNVVKVLAESGADIESMDDDKRTPLFYSILYGRKKIAHYLVEMGANVMTVDSCGYTLESLKHKVNREKIYNET